MRRVALAMAPVFALVAATFPALPAESSVGLDSAASTLGATFVSVSWNWTNDASGYRIQVSKHKDFSDLVAVRKPRSLNYRPPSGRQATVVGHLHDASYYWARVRKVSGARKSGWSAPVRVATKAKYPDPITNVYDEPGPLPGETTIHWRTDGAHTNFFRIQTALTPFSHTNPDQRSKGWMAHSFKVPASARSLTLTPEQAAAAGAPLGSGRHLLFRIYAMRKGPADSQKRWFANIQPATIAGMGSQGTGAPIRAASYNIRIAPKDVGTNHNWSNRAPLVASNLASVHPAIVGLQEMLAGMWTTNYGGPGLATALQREGLGSYQLTRTTPWSKTTPMDARILYDTDQLQLLSRCDDSQPTCGIPLPGGTVAAYGLFRDLSSGEEFWFVSAHLRPGDTSEQLRSDEAQTIVDAMSNLNNANLPVIYSADMNSFQTNVGHNLPHRVLMSAGFYDSSAAATQVHLEYNTVNNYADPERPSPNGFGARVDVIMTKGMQGASRFEEVRTGSPYPSDHNMVYADLKLPGN